MSKRVVRNLLQVIVALLLVMPTSMLMATPVAASGAVNLEVTKDITDSGMGSGETVYAGDTVTFEVTVINHTANDAEGVAVYDYMPAGFELVPDSLTASIAYVEVDPGVYRFDLGTVAGYANDSFEYDVTIAPDVVVEKDGYMSVDNSVRVVIESYSAWETDSVDNTDNLSLDVFELSGDLELVKVDFDESEYVVAGEPNEYYVGVINYGPSAARDVQLMDPLSDDEEFLSVEFVEGEGSCFYIASTHSVWCQLGTVAASDYVHEAGEDPFYSPSVSMIIHTQVKSSAEEGNTLTNCATISWPTRTGLSYEAVLDDEECFESTIDRQVSLTLSKESMPNPVTAGETLFYAITVTNDGPSDAADVRLGDVLPAGVTFVSAADNGEWTEVTPGELYRLNGGLVAGASASIVFEVETDSSLYLDTLPDAMITNTSQARTIEMIDDDVPAVSTAEDTYVDEEADLHVIKVGKPDGQVLAGQELEYTIFVYNLGPSDARNVTVLDDIVSLEGITILDYEITELPSSAGSSVNELTDQLEFEISVIPAGERAVIKILITSDEAVDVNNYVVVSSDTPDPDTTNNFDEVMHEIVAVSDLSVTKTTYIDPQYQYGPFPGAFVAGLPAAFIVQVTNNGPSEATNVVVKDFLPKGLDLIGIDMGEEDYGWMGGTPGDSSDPIQVNIGNLAADATAEFMVLVQIDPDFTGYISPDFVGWLINDVEVSNDNLDTDMSDNVDTAMAPVVSLADLEIVKGQEPDPVIAGEVIEWPIAITNYGPSVARNVEMLDFLPQYTDFITIDLLSGDAQCEFSWTTGAITCELGDMEPGETVVMNLRTQVQPDVENGTRIENTAYVGSRMLFTYYGLGYPMTIDPNTDNNESSDSGYAYRRSWLTVTKQSSPNPVLAGDKLYYEITVCNQGPSVASDISVADQLPGLVEFINYTGQEWYIESNVDGTITWATDRDLYPGECSSFMVEVLVSSAAAAWDWESTETPMPVDPYGSQVLYNDVCATWAESEDQSCMNEQTFVDEEADLYIVKEGKPDGEVLAGDNLEYTVYVYNLGISDARNVVVTDDILSIEGVTLVSADPTEGDGNGMPEIDSSVDNQLTVTKDVLQAGTRMAYKVVVSWPEGVDVNNLVHVESDTPDPDESNNDDETMHEIVPVSDLSIDKYTIGGSWYAGEDGVYEINVGNAGPSTAENVVVSDALPDGVEVTDVTFSGYNPNDPDDPAFSYTTGTPGDASDPMVISLGDMPAETSIQIQISVHIDSDYPIDRSWGNVGHLWNDVAVESDVFDPWMGNNSDSCLQETYSVADLALYKEAIPEVVVAGEPLEYQLQVINQGPSQAIDVGLVDELPANVEFVSATVLGYGDGTCTYTPESHLVACDLGTMANMALVDVMIVVKVNPDCEEGEQLSNTAQTFAWNTPADLDYYSNIATADVLVHRVADVQFTKETAPDPVIAGDKLYYTITITNNGPSVATEVGVADFWDAGVLGLPLNYTGPDWYRTDINEWQLERVLMPGESSSFVVEFMVDPGTANVTGSYVLSDGGVVFWDEEPYVWEGLVEESFVDEEADLYIVKVGKPDGEVLAGDPLEYTVYVYNLGLSDARNVVVTDNILSIEGVTLADAYATEGDGYGLPDIDTSVDNQLTVTKGVLEAGTRMAYKVVVTWPEGVDVNNLVHVESDTPDPDWSNNDDETMHEIIPVSDLSIDKSIDFEPGFAGESIVYHLEVENSGPSTAENVVVKDFIPAGLTITNINAAYGTYTEGVEGDGDQPLTFSLGNLEDEATWEAWVTCQIDVDFAGYLSNDATVESDVLDPNKADNADNATAVIETSADLVLNKDEDPDPVYAGDILDWLLIVTNNGPSMATQVGLVDFLPADVEFLGGEVFAGEANVTFSEAYGNVVAAEIGDLLPGDQVGIVLHTKVNSDADEGYIVNSAMVSSDPIEEMGTPDPSESNNVATASTRVIKGVNLSVVKSDDPDPVIAGNDLYYTVTVSNDGPSDATGILVSETFSEDVTFQNWTGSDEFELSGPGEWSLDYLAAGESKSFMIHVTVSADTVSKAGETTVISNIVSVMGEEEELDESDNTYTEDTFVNEATDLYVVKIGTPTDEVRAGQTLTYTIYVYNLGPSDARDVILTDDLLSDGVFTIESIEEADGYDCIEGETAVTCTADVHPAGERAEFTIIATATEDVDIVNWTCVESATPDTDTDNNCSQVITSVVPVSDLSVTKTILGGSPFVAGEAVTFGIVVTNNGPSTAENVVIEEYLPAYTSLLGTDPQVAFTTGVPGDPNAPMVIPVGTLESGESFPIAVAVLIDSDYPFDSSLGGEFLVNDVLVESDVLDDDVSNNRDSSALMVVFYSGIAVEKSVTPSPAMAGETVEYLIDIWNNGPSMAYDTFMYDDFDDEAMTFVDYVVSGVDAECFYDATYSEVQCEVGDIAVGTEVEIYLTFEVSTEVPDGQTVYNSAYLWVPSNIEQDVFGDAISVDVLNNADLTVTKTADKLEVYAGQELTYTITATNNGPTSAHQVLITDTLPEGVTYINDDLGGCTLDSGVLTCGVGYLAVGDSVTFNVLVEVNADTVGELYNSVIVESMTPDYMEGDNVDSVTTPVNGYADLRVQKFGKPEGDVRAGDELTYTIIVDNLGTGVAHDVTLVDEMFSDGDFELVSVESSMPVNEALGELADEFSMNGGFTLTLADDLPVTVGGDSWVITVTVVALDDQTINNSATVSAADFDPDLTNNEAWAEHEITNVADLFVTKSAEGEVQVNDEEGGVVELDSEGVTAGRFLFYTLTVENYGPSMAENVIVTDMLPTGVVLIESDPEGVYDPATGNLTWALGDMAAEDEVVIEIKVMVPAYTPEGTVLWNTASVTSDIFDDDNANNADTIDTYVGASADIIVSKVSTPETGLPGNDIDYTIMVKNLGPSDAGLVRIIDIIPDEIDYTTWKYTTDGGMTYTYGDRDVDVWVDMPADEMVEMTVSGVVNTYWPFENEVCATSVSIDDPMDENCDSVANEPILVFKPIELRGFEDTMHGPDLVVTKIVAMQTYIEVTVTNEGDRALLEPFWVDLYISPDPAPTAVNQIWEYLCDAGMGWAWKVTGDDGLPLYPGESLVLVVDGDESAMFPLAQGLTVYAQADSWNPDTDYGMVYEQDERLGLPYNNIDWVTVGVRVQGYDGDTTRDEGGVIRGADVFGAANDGLPARP